MKLNLRILLSGVFALLSLSATTFSVSAEKLSPFTPSRIEYSATYNGMPIHVVRELTKDSNGQFLFRSKAKNMLGTIEETGVFILDDKQLIQNTRYIYKRSILGSKKKERLHFDYTTSIATYRSGNKTREITLDQPFHNRISYQLQLQKDLILGCENLSYPVIARGKPKKYQFERVSEELLETPIGLINTVKVRRVRENSDRETTLWFAPELGYILVKLWQSENKEDYQIDLKSGMLNGVPLSALVNNLSKKINP